MMDEISGVVGDLPDISSRETNRSTLSQDQFLKIMISELTNQDPLEPLSNQEFLGQLTQMQTLETMTQLSVGIEALLVGQQISSAGTLIGKVVVGEVANGSAISGLVDRVVVEGQQVLLGIGEALIPLSAVHQVTEADG